MERPIGHDPRFVKVSEGIELLPSGGGRHGMEYTIATLGGVRDQLNAILERATVKARARLASTRSDEDGGHSKVIAQKAHTGQTVDAYLILDDSESETPGAMSIEFGRHGENPMPGKGILHAGFDLSTGELDGTGGGDL